MWIELKPEVFPSCAHVLPGVPPKQSLLPVAREPREVRRMHTHTHPGAAGAGAVAKCPSARPAGRRFRGQIWVAGSGGWAVTCLRESRLLPASRSRPAAAAVRAAAVPRVRSGDARRVWLRDSGGGPSSPRRQETLAVRPL